MKIGLVLSSTPEYSETFFNSKIKGLKEKGFDVCVFTQKKKPNFLLCPVFESKKVYKNPVLIGLVFVLVCFELIPHFKNIMRFINLERSINTSWSHILKKVYLNAHILNKKVDCLHFGFATQALGREFIAKSIKAKMTVSLRGFDINVYPLKDPNCYELLWKQVDKVHSISNYLYQEAIKLGMDRKTPKQIINPAVNIPEATNESKTIEFGKRLTILTIARLNWIKGIDMAIESMKILKEKGVDFEYHIVGAGNNGETEKCKYQVYNNELQNVVVFRGKLKHTETLNALKRCDIYLQPSLNEGFCNALLEAQALGKLCIATNVGGISENVVNNETGWLVNVLNPSAIANKIIEVLIMDSEVKNSVTLKAKQRIKKEFYIQKQYQEFNTFYTTI